MLVGRDVKSARVMIRDPSPATPVTVTMRGPGGDQTLAPARGEWQYVDLPISGTSWWSPWRSRHVVFTVSPTFVPAEIDSASTDKRALGVQLAR